MINSVLSLIVAHQAYGIPVCTCQEHMSQQSQLNVLLTCMCTVSTSVCNVALVNCNFLLQLPTEVCTHYLVYWVNEDSVSTVPLKSIVSPAAVQHCALEKGTVCSVRAFGKIHEAKVVGRGENSNTTRPRA